MRQLIGRYEVGEVDLYLNDIDGLAITLNLITTVMDARNLPAVENKQNSSLKIRESYSSGNLIQASRDCLDASYKAVDVN
jgi:hypothetical protein